MKELKTLATLEHLNEVLSFLEENLEEMGCSMKQSMRVQVAVEELFVNIANYAYPGCTDGQVTMKLEKVEEPAAVRITLIDSGIPYDPLAKPDPNVTLSAEERQIGGLGIYMVKQSMDEMFYEYRDGQNCLTLEKRI